MCSIYLLPIGFHSVVGRGYCSDSAPFDTAQTAPPYSERISFQQYPLRTTEVVRERKNIQYQCSTLLAGRDNGSTLRASFAESGKGTPSPRRLNAWQTTRR